MGMYLNAFKKGFDIGDAGGRALARTEELMKHDHTKGFARVGRAVKLFGSQYKIADRKIRKDGNFRFD